MAILILLVCVILHIMLVSDMHCAQILASSVVDG